MRKAIVIALLGLGMFAGTAAHAQSETAVPATPSKTEQVIASIPSLQSIHMEIVSFESKIEGQKEKFEHANEDLRALKMKYANELETQIAANSSKPEIVSVLTTELEKTRAEIVNLNASNK